MIAASWATIAACATIGPFAASGATMSEGAERPVGRERDGPAWHGWNQSNVGGASRGRRAVGQWSPVRAKELADQLPLTGDRVASGCGIRNGPGPIRVRPSGVRPQRELP